MKLKKQLHIYFIENLSERLSFTLNKNNKFDNYIKLKTFKN